MTTHARRKRTRRRRRHRGTLTKHAKRAFRVRAHRRHERLLGKSTVRERRSRADDAGGAARRKATLGGVRSAALSSPPATPTSPSTVSVSVSVSVSVYVYVSVYVSVSVSAHTTVAVPSRDVSRARTTSVYLSAVPSLDLISPGSPRRQRHEKTRGGGRSERAGGCGGVFESSRGSLERGGGFRGVVRGEDFDDARVGHEDPPVDDVDGSRGDETGRALERHPPVVRGRGVGMGAMGGVVCGWGRDGPLAEAKTRGVEEGFLAREPTSGGWVLAKRQADGGERDALGARGGGGGGGVRGAAVGARGGHEETGGYAVEVRLRVPGRAGGRRTEAGCQAWKISAPLAGGLKSGGGSGRTGRAPRSRRRGTPRPARGAP